MSGHAVLLVLALLGRAALLGASTVVNSCGSPAEQLCDFVCNCSDCSDENQCGYLGVSVVLGTPFTCDFEEGDCGWRDVSTSAYRWALARASLDAWGTGPHSDHTVGTNLGWFMAAADPPGKTPATAWLRSPVMREAAAACEIRAWYHLSGSGLNQTERPALRLALESGDETVELWQSPEHGGEGWHELVAYPGRTAGPFQLTFSLTPSPARGAQLVLDDIVFRNCGLQQPGRQLCEEEESACARGPCVPLDRFCDGTDDCGDGSDEAAPRCQPFDACSFERDLCGWEAEAGQPAWERKANVNSGAAYGLPSRDHSSNSRAGYFLRVGSASVARAGSAARLSSPSFQATNSCSLVLYCHLHGSATSSLSIYYVTASTKKLLRERTGDLGAYWVRERVEFNVTETFKVLIEGVANGTGTVALDDVILSPGCRQEQEKPQITLPGRDPAGPCTAEEFACDSGQCIGAELACDFAEGCADGSDEKRCGATTFEEGDGGWHDVSVGRLHWGVQRAAEPAGTTLRGAGAFLALQSGAGQMLTAAKARTPLLGPSGPACAMEMSYRIPSDHQGFLAVSVADHATGATQLAWQAQGHGSAAWQRVSVPLGERARPFQVELLGQTDLHDTASVAVDNVTFVHCDPGVAPPEAAEISCNFEMGMCGWYQDQRSDFRWVRGTGQGHGSDHTTGSGYFLAADPTAPQSRGQRAQLITYYQPPAAAATQCLSFWYRLAGPQIGTLSLKLKREEEEATVLWTRSGTQGSVWHRGLATLRLEGQHKYRLAFEALRDGFLGEVALDDVTLRAGPCGAQDFCSFEAGTCGLVASGQPTWLRQSSGTGATAAGPPADHTTGTAAGHYMLVSTSKGSLPAGRVAELTSELYEPSTQAQCLAFWYQLSGEAPGSLSVFVEESSMRTKLFVVSAMQGSTWHHGQVTIQADRDWRVIFEAAGGGGDRAYVALDDLHVMDGACPEPGSCDFELDTCGWSSPSDDHPHGFAWGQKSGVPLAKYPGPEQDHTLGTKDGHYMYFDASVLGPAGTAAQLESPHLPAAADSCLHFWYHMDIPEHLPGGELRVRLHSAEGQRTVWSMAGHQGWGWLSATVPVQSPSEFQIAFEITTRTWPIKGTIALDDVEYSAGRGCNPSPDIPGKEKKSSSSFVAEVVISLLLALIVLALVAAGGYYLLKRRGQASRMPAESSAPQGFDNITFQDDKVIISPLPKEGDED
ncbi:apical endosomal glycoprotein isoform X2 [Struthio camelus]|uniref:apical endosomal glycoprotein isoform X2 n=1 Tax=Struthio camelus TaxID=8801 RepID=UPI003603F75D